MTENELVFVFKYVTMGTYKSLVYHGHNYIKISFYHIVFIDIFVFALGTIVAEASTITNCF